MMKRIGLAAIAVSTVLAAAPASAKENTWYIGADIGVLLPRDTEIDIGDVNTGNSFNNAIDLQHKTGYDIDGVVGYDFGGFRVEGELGFKHSTFDAIDPSTEWITFLQGRIPGTIIDPSDIDLDDGIDIVTTMVNGMVDIGPDTGFNGYVGAGAGMGWAKAYGESDGSFAWQFIAGVRYPVTPTIDLGLKYRYFDMSSLDYNEGTDIAGTVVPINLDGNWRSHSILVNMAYNF
jgi:opacity protein-like surface antigen